MSESDKCYLEAWPKNTNEVAKLVKFAYTNNIPIRAQGNSHSENGSSLPKKFELLIHTTFLNAMKFDNKNIITVGSGIPISLVNQKLEELSDFKLPVYNGGGLGPSVGGYISAGGLSFQSEVYGGFWEQVEEITLVTGFGRIVQVKRNSPLFIWLFGSMGQLGIITQAKLKIMASSSKKKITFPQGLHLNISPIQQQTNHSSLYWFNLFVKDHELDTAIRDLEILQKKHHQVLQYHTMYHWKIAYLHENPPLVFPSSESFHMIGIWGTQKEPNQKSIIHLAQDFSDLVLQKQYKRYIQAEYLPDNPQQYYRKYFGEKNYLQFKAIKKSLDPQFSFNRGSVF